MRPEQAVATAAPVPGATGGRVRRTESANGSSSCVAFLACHSPLVAAITIAVVPDTAVNAGRMTFDPGCYRWISWFDPAAKKNTSEKGHAHNTFIANALLTIATAELQRDVRARWSGGNGGGRAGGHPAASRIRSAELMLHVVHGDDRPPRSGLATSFV